MRYCTGLMISAGMGLKLEFVNVALEVGDSAVLISADAVTQRAINIKQEEKRAKSQGMMCSPPLPLISCDLVMWNIGLVSDLFGGDDWVPDNTTAAKKKPTATKQTKTTVSSSLFDDSDDDDDFDFSFSGNSGATVAHKAAPKSIFNDGDDSDDGTGGTVSAVFQQKSSVARTQKNPASTRSSGGSGVFDDVERPMPAAANSSSSPAPTYSAPPPFARAATPAAPSTLSPPGDPQITTGKATGAGAGGAARKGALAAMVALEEQLAHEREKNNRHDRKKDKKDKKKTTTTTTTTTKEKKEKKKMKIKEKSSSKKPSKSAI